MLAIAAARLGWAPVRCYDHETAALEACEANAAANGVAVQTTPVNLREGLPPLEPTVLANLTAPLLRIVAAELAGREAPAALVCSGLLVGETDGVAEAMAGAGLVERERHRSGEWAAIWFGPP
ncbi:MAG: 50S ribosomal protein L11 methyltransferase [Solirubrobacterales bacterium]